VISFHYDLKDDKGQMIESSRGTEPMAFMEGVGQIIPGLEKALLELAVGQSKDVFVACEDAYGPYDQTLIANVPAGQFPTPNVKEGDVFQVEREGAIRLVTVVEVKDGTVTIDANHPMAGRSLNFTVEIVTRRDATPEELSHGHAHSGDGHHHH
ncbi:MAG: peptidylprolyl isomerase, partial [Candidatus Omnitrophota bacterium]|nr:peptidylprolyl isomerase [Candidatus Omnitrophota bacterium]